MNLDDKYLEYYLILAEKIPEFLYEYVNIPELDRINKIGMNCGTDYTNLFHNRCFYSRLNHSIGVSLILWKFSHDKKQAIAGLLHDIATPSFSHCIDYLHKDYMEQESTEERTKEIILSSKELRYQLEMDHIPVQEVYDYKVYPMADNSSPRLSADRLEYTLSSGMTFSQVWQLHDVQKIYSDIDIFTNEEGNLELGFKTVDVAEEFIFGASKMWYMFQSNKDKLVMQFWADIIGLLIKKQIISEDALYKLSEKDIVTIIQNCGIIELEKAFKNFQKASLICEGNKRDSNKYTVNISTKRRYINPLVCGVRATKISKKASQIIDDFINFQVPKYCWFDFELRADIFS